MRAGEYVSVLWELPIDLIGRETFLLEEAIPQPAIDWLMSQPACSEQK